MRGRSKVKLARCDVRAGIEVLYIITSVTIELEAGLSTRTSPLVSCAFNGGSFPKAERPQARWIFR